MGLVPVRAALGLLVLAAGTVACGQEEANVAKAGAAGVIVFSARHWEGEYWSRDIPGGVEIVPTTSAIYRVPADGSEAPQRIVDVAGTADNPQLSPEGQWLYFQARTAGRWNIYRCRPDGTDITNLTAGQPEGGSFGGQLSADGTRLVYTYNDGQIGRVGVMNADGTDARLVAPDIGYHYMGNLSPDNERVVFSHTAQGYTLALVELATGELRHLAPDHPDSYFAQFTPDGQTLVFFRRDGDVWRIGVDGQGLARLTEGNGYVEFRLSPQDTHGSSDPPMISPDGTRIAYCAVREGLAQVHTMNLDGTDQLQITHRAAPCGRVRWSPDGRHLAFVSWEGAYPQLFVVAAEGGEPVKLTDLPAAVYFPFWSDAVASGPRP